MPLERQSIEKKDFPIGRRGYDPEAVDAHLRAVADEMEELGGAARRRTETLASTASDQVRTIVEAAESSAAEILRRAEEEARDIRADANRAAQATREESGERAREYVARVSESTSAMVKRLDTMGSELTALLESLRAGSGRLDADLQLLARNLEEVRQTAAPQSKFETDARAETEPPTTAGATPGLDVEAAEHERALEFEQERTSELEQEQALELEQLVAAEAEVVETPAPEPEPAAGALRGPEDGSEDIEGARLIALNMALNHSSREETDRYLAEHFELPDRARLLDEVYASVGD